MVNKTILILIIIMSIVVSSCVTTIAGQLPSHIVSANISEFMLSESGTGGVSDIIGVVIDYGSVFSSNKKKIFFSDIQVPGCDVVRYEYFPPTNRDYPKIVFYCR